MNNEDLLRKHSIFGCQLIQEAGLLQQVSQIVVVTGQSILHRFYMRKPLSRYDAFTIAMGSYLLATKVEEKLLPLRDIIFVFHYLYLTKQSSTAVAIKPMELGGELYHEWKSELICIERNILRELGFSLYNSFNHPHQYLLYIIKLLEGTNSLAQCAWNYLNDSMHLNLITQYHSLYVVCAAIFLASRKIAYPLPETPVPWWTILHIDSTILFQIANDLMSLYSVGKMNWLDGLVEVPYLEKTKKSLMPSSSRK